MRSLGQRLLAMLPATWPERRQLEVLLAVMIVAAGAWAFIELADEVIEGEFHAIDEMILLALRNPANPADPLGPRWVQELGRDVTALGSIGVLSLFTLAAIGFLGVMGRWRTALLVAFGVVGGQALSSLLKLGFDRPRPDLVPVEVYVYTASFPSGHAMMSAVAYLTLGTLLARATPSPRGKAYILLCGLVLTVLVGLSRLYLGVHWPSDVLAGWLMGAAWASLWWLLAVAWDKESR